MVTIAHGPQMAGRMKQSLAKAPRSGIGGMPEEEVGSERVGQREKEEGHRKKSERAPGKARN